MVRIPSFAFGKVVFVAQEALDRGAFYSGVSLSSVVPYHHALFVWFPAASRDNLKNKFSAWKLPRNSKSYVFNR